MRQVVLWLFVFGHIGALGQAGADYLSMANKAYDAGDKAKAKELYEKAAALNNPDAHYALAYKYVVSRHDAIYHYSQAARAGNGAAMGELFEVLMFRSNSLTLTDPGLAYEIYQQAKKQNPVMEVFWEEDEVATLKNCIEAGPFDAQEFIKKYNIGDKDTNDNTYSIWELAAEASHKGRFGPANPKLVLQLACRGGSVPAESISAVRDAYDNWKSNRLTLFNPCDYVTSGTGLAYCTGIESKKAEKDYLENVKDLEAKLRHNAGPMLRHVYEVASAFISVKAALEEGSDGTGRSAWINESIVSQKASFLDQVKKVNDGFCPRLDTRKDYDKELNETYKKVIAGLKEHSIKGSFFEITDHDVVIVQRKWIAYRDSVAALFAAINPSLNIQQWKDYQTEIRTGQLKEIEKMR